MLKLKLQYFGHLMRRADSLEKTLPLEKIEDKRKKGRQRMRWLDSITDSMDMNSSKLWEIVEDRGAWHASMHGITKSWTLSNWITTIAIFMIYIHIYIYIYTHTHTHTHMYIYIENEYELTSGFTTTASSNLWFPLCWYSSSEPIAFLVMCFLKCYPQRTYMGSLL